MMMMMCLIFDTSLAVAACADDVHRNPKAMMPPNAVTVLQTNRIHSLLKDVCTSSLIGRSVSELGYAIFGIIPRDNSGQLLAATAAAIIPHARGRIFGALAFPISLTAPPIAVQARAACT